MKRKATYKKGNITIDVVRSNSEVCLIMDMKINGVQTNIYEFGTMKDLDPKNAPPCGCGDRSFVPNCTRFNENTLQKYGLTIDDADDLMTLLKTELHIGQCKRCR